MSTSENQRSEAVAQTVRLEDHALEVALKDGRVLVVPIGWFPRLAHGTPDERANWILIGRGEGIHWPDLDEDISVESLLAGRQSGESAESFQRWMREKSARPPETGSIHSEVEWMATIPTHSFLTHMEHMFGQELLGVELTNRLQGEQPTSALQGPTGGYATAVPEIPTWSGVEQMVDLPAKLYLGPYTNPLPGPAARGRVGGKRLPHSAARKKRSRSARPIAA